MSLCWAVMFVILSVIYRPIEQLLSRTIADRRARGLHGHPLRIPAMIQLSFALLFLAAALALRDQIEQRLFGGSSALYWILVVGVLAYAASYFARGWLAGHQRFALYGGLVFLESTSRFAFAFAVAIGIASGEAAVALGMAVAPFVSLSVIPFAFSRVRHPAPAGLPAADAAREGPAHAAVEEALAGPVAQARRRIRDRGRRDHARRADADERGGADRQPPIGRGARRLRVQRAADRPGAAAAVPGDPDLDPAAPGRVSRRARAREEFHRAILLTIRVIAAFAGAVALGLLLIGPPVMTALLGDKGFHYGRFGLAVVGLGMGLHLISGTLNQAALARHRARIAAICWLAAAALFVAFVGRPDDLERGHAGRGRLLPGDADPVRPADARVPAGPAAAAGGEEVAVAEAVGLPGAEELPNDLVFQGYSRSS